MRDVNQASNGHATHMGLLPSDEALLSLLPGNLLGGCLVLCCIACPHNLANSTHTHVCVHTLFLKGAALLGEGPRVRYMPTHNCQQLTQ